MSHEFSLMAGLLRQVEEVAKKEDATKVYRIELQLGPLAHISAPHLREHLVEATKGTIAEEAEIEIHTLSDRTHPQAQEIILKSVDVEA